MRTLAQSCSANGVRNKVAARLLSRQTEAWTPGSAPQQPMNSMGLDAPSKWPQFTQVTTGAC